MNFAPEVHKDVNKNMALVPDMDSDRDRKIEEKNRYP